MSSPENLDHFATLIDIIARLRAPNGCPWDRKQTHASLRENLLEECYEVLEALDEGDSRRLCDELGDLFMQIVLHAQIASEAGAETILLRRHSVSQIHWLRLKGMTPEDLLHNLTAG